MIQFTLGCILLALTLFFGGREILANNTVIENRTKSFETQESTVARAASIKAKYENIKDQTIILSDEIKQNLINQLNIDETKHSIVLTEPTAENKVLNSYDFTLEGFDNFSKVFNLVSDIEKIKGIHLNDVCFNCQIANKDLIKREAEIGFNIKGKVYVYKEEK